MEAPLAAVDAEASSVTLLPATTLLEDTVKLAVGGVVAVMVSVSNELADAPRLSVTVSFTVTEPIPVVTRVAVLPLVLPVKLASPTPDTISQAYPAMLAPLAAEDAEASSVTVLPATTLLEDEKANTTFGGVLPCTADRAAEASSMPAPQVLVVQ